MTDIQENEKIYSPDEIHEMLDTSFLPKLQEFAKRIKKEMVPDEEIAFFMVQLQVTFSDLENPLSYRSIHKDVHMQLQTVLQKDVDKTKVEAKEAETLSPQEKDAKDTGDRVV